MEITRHSGTDRRLVQRYGGGGFRVSGTDFKGSVIVLPGETLVWPVTALETVRLDDFAPLVSRAKDIDVCLLGCGTRMLPIPREVREALKASGLTVDPMDTGAACRTFNVLMGEGRAVAAALIAV